MTLAKSLTNYVLDWISLNRPVPIQFDITNACNLTCAHCYHDHHSNKGAIRLSRWLELINEYAETISQLKAKPAVIFCGGEPTLSPNLLPMVQRCEEIWGEDYSATILTNGTTTDRIDFNSLDNQRISFQVSFDGPNARVHDEHRGRNSFERTVQGIKELRGRGYEVRALAVLSKANSEMIREFFRVAKDLDLNQMNFTRIVPLGTAKSFAEGQPLEPLALKKAMLEIMECAVELGVKTQVQTPLAVLLNPHLGRSGRFWEALVVDYQGNFLASSRSRLSIGHIDKNRMIEVLGSSFSSTVLRKGKIEVCGDCGFLDKCGGDRNAAYSASGNFYGPDPGCWKHLN